MRRVWMALAGLALWLGVARAAEGLPMFAGVPDGESMASAPPESTVALLYMNRVGLDACCSGLEQALQEAVRQKLLEQEEVTAMLRRAEKGLVDFRRELQALGFEQLLVALGTTDCREVEVVAALRFGKSVSDAQLQRSLLAVAPELNGVLEIQAQGVYVKGELVLPLHWLEERRVLVMGADDSVPKALARMSAKRPTAFPNEALRLLGREGFQLLFVNQPCLREFAAGQPQLSREALGFHLPLAAAVSSDAVRTRLQMEFGAEADARKVSEICGNLIQMAVALVEKLKTAPLLEKAEMASYKAMILQTLQGVQSISSHAEGTRAVVEMGEGGSVVFAVVPIGAAVLLPASSAARERARCISCVNNVKQMLLGCMLYAEDSEGRLPPSAKWTEVLKEYGGKQELECPGGGRYGYYGGGWKTREIPKPDATVILVDEKPHGQSFVVGFADGHVLTIPMAGSLEESVKKAGYVLLQPKDVK